MPDINITTERGKVHASVSGTATRCMGDVLGDLNMDSSMMRKAVERLYRGHNKYEGVTLFGYTINLTPEKGDIEVEECSKITAVTNDVMRNDSKVTGAYDTSLRHKVTHSIDLKWSSTLQVTKDFSIGGDFYIKGTGHMDFTTTTGKQVSKQMTEEIGSTRQLSVTLRPGERVRASLLAKKRNVKVTVPFLVEIEGHVAGRFANEQPTTFDLKDVLRAAGKHVSYRTVAEIDITCFTDADVSLFND